MLVDVLAAFVQELRRAGIPASMVEAIDATEALAHVDLLDRDAFKTTLGATLVKHARHEGAFDVAAIQTPGFRLNVSAQYQWYDNRIDDLGQLGQGDPESVNTGFSQRFTEGKARFIVPFDVHTALPMNVHQRRTEQNANAQLALRALFVRRQRLERIEGMPKIGHRLDVG